MRNLMHFLSMEDVSEKEKVTADVSEAAKAEQAGAESEEPVVANTDKEISVKVSNESEEAAVAEGEGETTAEGETAADVGGEVETGEGTGEDAGLAADAVEANGEGGALTEMLEEEPSVSQEGFMGGLVGWIVGGAMSAVIPFAGGAAMGAAAKATIQKQKQDILEISERIAKLRNGEIDEAVKKGTKLPSKIKKVDAADVVKGALLGLFFGPFYGAYKGSQMENEYKKLQEKIKELEYELKRAGVSVEDFGTVPAGEEDEAEPVPEVQEVVEENSLEVPEPAEVTDEEVVKAEEEIETADEEIVEDGEEIDEAVKAQEEAVELNESMENYVAILQHGLRTKQYSAQFAATTQLELERVGRVFGSPAGLPALEDYSVDNDGLGQYYNVALESFLGFMKRVSDVMVRLDRIIPDYLTNGKLVRQYQKKAGALNTKLDKTIAELGNVTSNEKVAVSVGKALAGKGGNLQQVVATDLRTISGVVSKGLPANAVYLKKVTDVLNEATGQGGVNRTGAIVAKAADIKPALSAYPEAAFSEGFAGGKVLEKKADAPSLGIPSVGSVKSDKLGDVELGKVEISKLLQMAKTYVSLATKAADETGADMLRQIKQGRSNRKRALAPNGMGDGSEHTTWKEGKELDNLATSLVRNVSNHVKVYTFSVEHCLRIADELESIASKAISKLS